MKAQKNGLNKTGKVLFPTLVLLEHTKALGAFISQLHLREGFSLHGKVPGRFVLMEKGFC